jgi:hypothetical protein
MPAITLPVPMRTDHARCARSAVVTVVLPDTPPLVAVMVAVPTLKAVTIRSPSIAATSGAEDDQEKRPGSSVEP